MFLQTFASNREELIEKLRLQITSFATTAEKVFLQNGWVWTRIRGGSYIPNKEEIANLCSELFHYLQKDPESTSIYSGRISIFVDQGGNGWVGSIQYERVPRVPLVPVRRTWFEVLLETERFTE